MIDGRTLWELVERRARETPDALFLMDEGKRTMTFAEYRDAAERAAAGLAAFGVGEDTPVTWELPTWIESFVLVAALARLGAVQNPIMPIYRQREVSFVTNQTEARLLIVPTTFRGFDYKAMADEIAAGLDGLEVLVADRELPDGDPATLSPPPSTEGELPVRWLFYTSGTTADPKGAQHTDATIMASARAMAERLEFSPDDVHGFVFPFTHIGGAGLLMGALMAGMTHVIVETFDPAAVVDLFDREGATLAGAGTVFHQAYLTEARKRAPEKVLQKVRAWIGGGAPKPPQLHYDVKGEIGGVGIVSGYGLTEAPILTMASVHDADDKLAQSEGRASPGVELKVVTFDGKVAGPGEEGEIRAKGPQVCLGTSTRRSTPTPSTTTGGSAPATSATWTTRATSSSPVASRTSSSARVRTSAPRRSRTCSTRTRRSPMSPSSACPTRPSASGAAPWSRPRTPASRWSSRRWSTSSRIRA